jgi:RNA polymerase sigma-70 factor (ECF subfamily)
MSHAAAVAFADGGLIPGIHLSMALDSLPAGSRSLEEAALVRRIRQGDSERFADLIERYQRHVGRIVGRRVPADRVAELVHEVFVKAYVNLPQFSNSVPFEHWLAGIAVRTCYDFWRQRTRDEVPASALSDDHQRWIEQTLSAASEQEFRDQAAKREAADVLEWALRQLAPEQRAVLTLVHLEGYSVREAAQLLGWSVINVKVRAHRARRALRGILHENTGGGSHDASS